MMKITLFALIAGLLMLGGCAQELDFQETKRLAEGGDKIAQSKLGVMYKNGTGVPQDDKEAYAWLSVAKANSLELAEKNLGNVTKKMTKEQIVQAKSLSIEISKRSEANRKD